ncbi:uncharacterized protein PHACADRAFT_259827 [Phanerochaete carnosa HHB-10118-sp]|uniref:Uncharacterized protein n=1 Tax=Phanerochaete carnosa (strain HHB-10118-sp) TaxID=650164 RepID=K5UTY8_PHACS|nr:uncharacterized protein PHACADRAFT_259827 [Phanerochaete carnosa HHB-10118-sp]EKM53441.1 hypothetical protein PHACADRAFT_259827 [Phanerochaete carnosa HHB-10118-sp]
MTKRSILDALYRLIVTPTFCFVASAYRYLLLVHIDSLPYFDYQANVLGEGTSGTQRDPALIPPCVHELWTASGAVCTCILTLLFISLPLHCTSVATSTTLVAICFCCVFAMSLRIIMTWHVSATASTWPNAAEHWTTLTSSRTQSYFSATPMLLAAPVAWAAWASVLTTVLFFMVTYNGSVALAVEQYVEFVKDMKAIVNGSYSSGTPTLPPAGVCRTSLLTAFVAGVVVAIGILHMCLIMTRFSQLGVPSSNETIQHPPSCTPVVSREERSNHLNGPTDAAHTIGDNSLAFVEEGRLSGDDQDRWE